MAGATMTDRPPAAKIPLMHWHVLTERRLLALILILFVLLGFIYALITPPFEASDELWHYPMIQHLADGNPLPVQVFDPALAGPWNQEASQPPLYYYLGAALTFWIDQSDMPAVRLLNPHVDNGVITPDGNNNLAIHDPAADLWAGALLALHIVRLFSVLLGAVTVWLTYRIAGETAPDRPEIALGAAAINAFLPMFLFISGAVNNDNLAVLLASLALLLLIRIVTRRRVTYFPVHWWEWATAGVVIGLAALTKEGTLGLLPMAFGTAVVAAWQILAAGEQGGGGAGEQSIVSAPVRPRSSASSAIRGLLSAIAFITIPVLLIAGWWYYRNIVLYGDWLGWSAFMAVLGQRGHPASLIQLWGERRGFLMSFWGLFGGVNVSMSPWVYAVLNAVLVASVLGFVVYLGRLLRLELGHWRARTEDGWFARLLRIVERHFGLIVNLIFAAAVVYGLIQWATTTWSSQGRLVFTAIASLATLMALGLAGWLPRKPAAAVLGAFGVFLFLIAAAAPWVWIRPTYQPPAASASLSERLGVTFGDRMRLAGYEVETGDLRPGDPVRVRLEWKILQPMDRDWSVFIHLNDPVLGRPIAQRDMYPGAGLLATHLLEPGRTVIDEYVLTVPPTAVAPAELELVVGLYDFATGERLLLPDGRDALTLQTIPLAAGEGPYPNPVSLFFEHGLELVGFSVEPRRVSAGETVELATFWRPSKPLPADFTFFAQIVGPDTTRYAAADVAPPQPTSGWQMGEVVELRFSLPVDPATPPDAYPLIVGLYTRTADGGFGRLQQVTADGRLTDDFLILTLVRVDAP